MTKRPLALTPSEWAILRTVWNREPCAAPDVQEALHPTTRWTYSTVRTLMDRMVTKGLLVTQKVRHMNLYRSAITRHQAQRSELNRTLKQAFDGALTPMVQCLLDHDALTAEDLEELEGLLRARRKSQSR